MKTILGKVTNLNARTKSLTVSAEVTGPGGSSRNKTFEVPWTETTNFKSKGKKKRKSSPEKVKPGMNVIVHLEETGRPAKEVLHETLSTGTIALTATECKNLGGTLVDDQDCPWVKISGSDVEIKQRCKTAGGSMCIDETA